MKKALLYFLVILMLAENTELHQLAKLPILFEHFAEHQQLDKSVSLLRFLSMHYLGEDMNDDDNDRDMQLPFKKLDTHNSQVYFMPTIRIIAAGAIEQPVDINTSAYSPGHFSDPALSALFRPPRV